MEQHILDFLKRQFLFVLLTCVLKWNMFCFVSNCFILWSTPVQFTIITGSTTYYTLKLMYIYLNSINRVIIFSPIIVKIGVCWFNLYTIKLMSLSDNLDISRQTENNCFVVQKMIIRYLLMMKCFVWLIN